MLAPMAGASFSRRGFFGAAGWLVLASPATAAEPQPGGIEIENAWIRPASKASPTTMAFFEIVNHTDHTEYLLSVTSPAGGARLNTLRWRGSSASTEELKSIAIPPSSRVVLKPGETFVTLREDSSKLHVGQSLTLSLHFETAGTRNVSADVVNQLLGNRR